MLLGGSTAAFAQMTSREAIELQNQLAELRQQMNQMQSTPAPSMAPPSSSSAPAPMNGDLTAQLLDRVSTLEQQVRDMRGQLDELNNQVQQQNATLGKRLDDMNFAMQNGGRSGGGAAPAVPAAAGPAPAPAAHTPDALLKEGNAALLAHNYDAAHTAAVAAAAQAKGAQKIDAQFLVAQSLAGQKQYRQSAVAYYDAYSRAPKGTRAPDALLGVTASMLALGDKNSACQALEKLTSEFPALQPRAKSAAAYYRKQGSCH
ncbi:hypothetical protein KGY14_06465 [Ameyamaea chiangmaiensis]|nr:hypothetical protein [Ameyamaea chiangmaiensis]MBS4074832.1 hypothetical protein [Ameyamaea chiangmaiensis]